MSKTGTMLSNVTTAKGLATPVAHPTVRARTLNRRASIVQATTSPKNV